MEQAKIGLRTAQLVFDFEDNLVLLSLDNENGFSTLPRGRPQRLDRSMGGAARRPGRSSSASLLLPGAALSLPAARVATSNSAGLNCSSTVSTRPGCSNLLQQFGPRTPCLRTLGAGSADRAGLSTVGGPTSNTACSSEECAFYSPPPPPPTASFDAPVPFLCSCGSTIFADERYALPLP